MSRYQHTIRYSLLTLIALASTAIVIHYGDSLRFEDENLYWGLGSALKDGLGFIYHGMPSTQRPPGYPMVIAIAQYIADQPVAPKLFNVIFLVATSVIVAALAERIYGSQLAAPCALALILLYPIFHFTSSTLYPQIFGSFLFVSIVFIISCHTYSLWYALIAGVLYGFLLLTIPAFLLIAPLLILGVIWIAGWASWKFSVRYTSRWLGIFLLASFLVLFPWILRNAFVFERFVPLSTNSGLVLLQSYSEYATASSGASTDIAKYTDAARDARMSQFEADLFFRRSALAWIRQNPSEAITLYGEKILVYFAYRNDLATASETSSLRNTVSAITYLPLLALSVIRIAFLRKYPMARTEAFLYIIYFSNAFISSIFFPRIRFRIPYDFLLISVVAAFLAWSAESARRRFRASPPMVSSGDDRNDETFTSSE